MLTKEICAQAFNDMKMYGGINIPPLAFDIFKRLIEEHFNPKPLKFEDLKAGMWVWNSHFKNCERIYSINYETKTIRTNDTGFEFIEKEFMENRFYPITIPNIGDKNG